MAAQASLTHTLSTKSHHIHSFFNSLPRELRDNIYDLLYHKFYQHGLGRPYVKSRVPYVAFRLVSRQCKLEFDEWVAKRKDMTTLRICDWKFWFPTEIIIPGHYARTTHVRLKLYACHDDRRIRSARRIAEALRLQAERIKELASYLPCLCSIRVVLITDFEECLRVVLESLGLITGIDKCDQVTVGHTELREHGLVESRSRKTSVFAMWTSKHGLALNRQAGALLGLP